MNNLLKHVQKKSLQVISLSIYTHISVSIESARLHKEKNSKVFCIKLCLHSFFHKWFSTVLHFSFTEEKLTNKTMIVHKYTSSIVFQKPHFQVEFPSHCWELIPYQQQRKRSELIMVKMPHSMSNSTANWTIPEVAPKYPPACQPPTRLTTEFPFSSFF